MTAVEEFVAQAKKRQAELPFGSLGLRNSLRLAHEYFNVRSGIRMAHVLFMPTPNCPPPCRLRIDQCLASGGGGQSKIDTTRRPQSFLDAKGGLNRA